MKKSTFVEKILNAPAGSIVTREPDIVLSHDNSARIKKIFKRTGGENILSPEKLFVVLDRKLTGTTDELARDYNAIRCFMAEQHVKHFFDCDKGICHQLLADYLKPGMLIAGSDSHTCTAGAFNCFAVGVNKTETAILWKEGKLWFRVPETLKINLSGKLRKGVYAKDLAIWIMGMLREEHAEYKAIEYHGEGVRNLNMADRMTLANVSAEMGVKNSVFPPDDVLADHFGDYAIKGVWADEGADYEKEFDVNLSEVMPLVLLAHEHNEVKTVEECSELEVQQGLIGACSNGRMEDLRVVAALLENKRVYPGFQLFVVPASREIYLQARAEGIVDTITRAGGAVLGASCGPCLGSSHILQANTSRFITTTNSRAMHRMEDMGVEKYIASPATVVMTALTGKITAEQSCGGEMYPYWGNPVEPIRIDALDNRKEGKVWNYSDADYVSCKQIFPEEYTYRISVENGAAMKPFVLAGLDASFAGGVEAEDILLMGECLGCGHLLKHAVAALKATGVKAVVVKSASRNFFRLALNMGLPVIIAPEAVEAYRPGMKVEVDEGCLWVGEKVFDRK